MPNLENSIYTIKDIEQWAEEHKLVGSFTKVGKKFSETNIKTIIKYLKKYKQDFGLFFEHEERIQLQNNGFKRCNGKCKLVKELNKFDFNKTLNYYRSECKNCNNVKDKIYRDAHKEEIKFYQQGHRIKNKDILRERDKERYQIHKKEWIAKQKQTYIENKSEIRKRRKARHKERIKSDPLYALRHTLRSRMNGLINGQLEHSTLDFIGCSIEQLKEHLEKYFYINSKTNEMMTWYNKGFYGWHVDHIIPLASAKDNKSLIALFHYSNLQPLWAEENFSKGAKL